MLINPLESLIITPQGLPLGLPPMRQGHDFKIDLEDYVSLTHCPLCKVSPL